MLIITVLPHLRYTGSPSPSCGARYAFASLSTCARPPCTARTRGVSFCSLVSTCSRKGEDDGYDGRGGKSSREKKRKQRKVGVDQFFGIHRILFGVQTIWLSNGENDRKWGFDETFRKEKMGNGGNYIQLITTQKMDDPPESSISLSMMPWQPPQHHLAPWVPLFWPWWFPEDTGATVPALQRFETWLKNIEKPSKIDEETETRYSVEKISTTYSRLGFYFYLFGGLPKMSWSGHVPLPLAQGQASAATKRCACISTSGHADGVGRRPRFGHTGRVLCWKMLVFKWWP